MHTQALAARGHHLRHQQAGQHPILLRNVPAYGQPRRLLAADCNRVRNNQLADILEAHRRLVQRNLVVVGQRVDQIGCRHAFGHAVFPSARLHQVVEQQRNNVVGLDKRPIRVHNAEAVRISIRRNAQRRAYLPHLRLRIAQQLVGRLRRMAAKQNIPKIVNRRNRHARLAQQMAWVAAPRAPERIVDHLDTRLCNRLQIDQFGNPLQKRRLHVRRIERDSLCLGDVKAVAQPRNRRLNLLGHLGQRRRAVVRGKLDAVVLRRIMRGRKVDGP